jgi:hypothetical protein
MIDSPLNLEKDFNFILKGIDNLPKTLKDNNVSLLVNDYYLDFNTNVLDTKKLIIVEKNKYGNILFNKVLDLVTDGCVSCLIKLNNNWYFTSIKIISMDKITISLIRKLKDKSELKKIKYLSDTIEKLKNKLVPKKIIRKYISSYFEYLKENTSNTNLNSNKTIA